MGLGRIVKKNENRLSIGRVLSVKTKPINSIVFRLFRTLWMEKKRNDELNEIVNVLVLLPMK